MFEHADVIHRYSRADALRDGVATITKYRTIVEATNKKAKLAGSYADFACSLEHIKTELTGIKTT